MPVRKKIVWLSLFLLPVAWQLWVSPVIGLADNGDFAKVVGRFALAPVDPGPQPTFHFFHRYWQIRPDALWVSPYWGTEVLLARLALWIGKTNPFDMVTMGLVHVAILLAAMWFLLGKKAWANGFALLAFSDAAYVTYFHSFYFDAASIVFLLLLIACWYADQPVGLAIACLGFALSKGPHAPLAIVLGMILMTERKWRLAPAVVALLVGGGYMLSQTREEYKAIAYYNLAFFKLGLMDTGSLDALQIRASDRHLVGTHAFLADSPAQDAAWLMEFFPKGGYGNAALYYLKHPSVAVRVLWSDLVKEAPEIRAENLGNYERVTGKRYCTLSTAFGWYSGAKSWLFRHAPWHVFVLFAIAFWRIGNRPLLWGVVAVSVVEFLIASLADACETHRHLLLFHLGYDLLIWLSLAVCAETQSKQGSSV